MALTYTPPILEKFLLPTFELPTVLGENWSSKNIDASPAKIIVFICNHCPYVKAIEGRLIKSAAELKKMNVPLVGICSNDATEYPEDRPEELKRNWLSKKYEFAYLLDESQIVAKNFNAVCTPDFFVFNSNNELSYRGRIDDSWRDETKVTRQELKLAVMSILTGQPLSFEPSPSMGCSIKWRD